jgi:hypothetical protein
MIANGLACLVSSVLELEAFLPVHPSSEKKYERRQLVIGDQVAKGASD